MCPSRSETGGGLPTDEGGFSLYHKPLTTACAEPLPREKPFAKRTVEEINSREIQFKQFDKSKFEGVICFFSWQGWIKFMREKCFRWGLHLECIMV